MNIRALLAAGALATMAAGPAVADYHSAPPAPPAPSAPLPLGTVIAPGPDTVVPDGLAAGKGAISVVNLNLRAGPGTEHPPITVIPAGAAVEIQECIADVGWCQVAFGGVTGFAAARYLQPAPQ